MKKLFITLLLLCFYIAQGAHGAMIIQQFTASGGCSDTPDDTCASEGDGSGYSCGNLVDYLAVQFTASQSGDICSVRSFLKNTSSATEDVAVEIWSDNGGEPGAIIGTASDTVSLTTISTSFQYVTFTGIVATGIQASSNYWIIFNPTNTTNNYFEVERVPVACSPELIVSSGDDGSTWDAVNSVRSLVYDVYYTE